MNLSPSAKLQLYSIQLKHIVADVKPPCIQNFSHKKEGSMTNTQKWKPVVFVLATWKLKKYLWNSLTVTQQKLDFMINKDFQ